MIWLMGCSLPAAGWSTRSFLHNGVLLERWESVTTLENIKHVFLSLVLEDFDFSVLRLDWKAL